MKIWIFSYFYTYVHKTYAYTLQERRQVDILSLMNKDFAVDNTTLQSKCVCICMDHRH